MTIGESGGVLYWPEAYHARESAAFRSLPPCEGMLQARQAYLDYLWSTEGQDNAAQNYLRPRDAEVLKRYAAQFPPIKTFSVDEVFGGWAKAFPKHFKDGGTFDQIYQSK